MVDHLAAGGWDVVSLSRREPEPGRPGRSVAVDLLNRTNAKQQLAELTDTTHVFYAGYQSMPTHAQAVLPNLDFLVHSVETLTEVAPGLRHVTLVEGGKWYGFHLGPTRTPAAEDDPRHMPPNFYYDQQDWLEAAAGRYGFDWTALRPDVTIGFALGSPMNLGTAIAVYAAICHELKVPFTFPGSHRAWDSLFEVTDARLLGRAAEWAATTPAAAGEAFNITNGEHLPWSTMWPRLADIFGFAHSGPRPMPLTEFMADKGPVWDRIVAKHGLLPLRYDDLVSWQFADDILNMYWDVAWSTTKARRYGFDSFMETDRTFAEFVAKLQHDRIIPTW